MVKREQPASDPARKVRFGIKKVLSCEQEEATMPAGAFYGQETTMPVSGFAREVRLETKKVHFMVKKRPCPQVHFMVKKPKHSYLDI